VALSSSIMFVRVLVIVALVDAPLAAEVSYAMGAGAAAGLGASAALWLRSGRARTRDAGVTFSNPFELTSALRFALLFAIILLGSTAATRFLGTAGTYAASVLAGTSDVDAISLSMAKLAGDGGVSNDVAATAIFLGVASNTLTKGAMGAMFGGWAFGRRVLGAQMAMLAAGAIGAIVARS
jgi:uncharacterized membrane protein (DUF4010 family)